MTFCGLDQFQSQLQILIYIGLAMLLGAAIGFEHEWADKPAGLRTHMLVAGAPAVGVSVALSQFVLAIGSTGLVLITLRGVGGVQRWLARRPGDERET